MAQQVAMRLANATGPATADPRWGAAKRHVEFFGIKLRKLEYAHSIIKRTHGAVQIVVDALRKDEAVVLRSDGMVSPIRLRRRLATSADFRGHHRVFTGFRCFSNL